MYRLTRGTGGVSGEGGSQRIGFQEGLFLDQLDRWAEQRGQQAHTSWSKSTPHRHQLPRLLGCCTLLGGCVVLRPRPRLDVRGGGRAQFPSC